MPPKPRTPEKIQLEREKIISLAAEMIHDKGLENFTMRKLSARLNMSATNIYNYFYNKDEIYLHILIMGFKLLKNEQETKLESVENPKEKLKAYLVSLIDFGIKYPSYYQLMFNTKDPKYLDYLNTPFAKLAEQESLIAMERYNVLYDLVSCCINTHTKDVNMITTRILCEVHGGITLHYSNVVRELNVEFESCMENLLEHIMSEFK